MTMQHLSLTTSALAPSGEHRVRELAIAALRLAGRALERVAERLTLVHAAPPVEPPTLEFHADAGAPEGALYVNGELVGKVLGVTRL